MCCCVCAGRHVCLCSVWCTSKCASGQCAFVCIWAHLHVLCACTRGSACLPEHVPVTRPDWGQGVKLGCVQRRLSLSTPLDRVMLTEGWGWGAVHRWDSGGFGECTAGLQDSGSLGPWVENGRVCWWLTI